MHAMLKRRWVWITLLFAAINIVGLAKIVSVLERRPGAAGWCLVMGLSLLPLIGGQILRLAQRRRMRSDRGGLGAK